MKYAIRFLCVVAFLFVMEQTSFWRTRQVAYNEWNKKERVEELIRLPAKSQSRVRVTAQMEIVLEEYDETTNRVVKETPYWNEQFVGFDESELRTFLSDSSNLKEKGDEKRGYYESELVLMDRMKLKIRKCYRLQNEKGKDINLYENTSVGHWSWSIRAYSCDLCGSQWL